MLKNGLVTKFLFTYSSVSDKVQWTVTNVSQQVKLEKQ